MTNTSDVNRDFPLFNFCIMHWIHEIVTHRTTRYLKDIMAEGNMTLSERIPLFNDTTKLSLGTGKIRLGSASVPGCQLLISYKNSL